MGNIYILSGPIRSGKTSCLMNFAMRNKNVKGILTPDIHGIKRLYSIDQNLVYDFEVDHNHNDTIKVGKFVFRKSAFKKGIELLNHSLKHDPTWLIIDEIGKLETQHNLGFEPGVNVIIEQYKTSITTGNLLLVVRDSLVESVKAKYHIPEAKVVDQSFFNNAIYHNISQNKTMAALIMCGGKSERMNRHKFLLEYHAKPQGYFLYDELKILFHSIHLSVNKTQLSLISNPYRFIVDNDNLVKGGPMCGLLSAMQSYLNTSFFVFGCDYPFISKTLVQFFINQIQNFSCPAALYNFTGKGYEPMLAYYPHHYYENLQEEFLHGRQSLYNFLETNNAQKVIPWDVGCIKSIDNPEEYDQAMKKVNRFLS